MPLGWQAKEDWERGVGFSGDKRYRLIVWRVDFAFEGVNDAEHYAATKAGAIQARKPGIARPGTQARRRHVPDCLPERSGRRRAARGVRPRGPAAGPVRRRAC